MRLALPSKGELEGPTMRFLDAAGLAVDRPNERQYTGSIPSLPGTQVLFQRAADIPIKVEEGSADAAITGYDAVMEHARHDGRTVVLMPRLGYSRCELVLAVPDGWLDVASFADLADVAQEFRDEGKALRVATKYTRLTSQFFTSRGVTDIRLVPASGALEAAPAMGYADLIADLTSSGTTLRENRLKTIAGGTILESQACLVANRQSLRNAAVRERIIQMLEAIEARMRASGYRSLVANLHLPDEAAIAEALAPRPDLLGLAGPTIARVHGPGGSPAWAVTVVVGRALVPEAVAFLRRAGASSITVETPQFLYLAGSEAVRDLERLMEGDA